MKYLLFIYDEYLDECDRDIDLFCYNGMTVLNCQDVQGSTFVQITMDSHLRNNIDAYVRNLSVQPDSIFLYQEPCLSTTDDEMILIDQSIPCTKYQPSY